MSDTLEQKLQQLDTQLEDAIVKQKDDGIFAVFVPGAVRQYTTVKAESEEEAVSKVRDNLIVKLKHFDSKPPVSPDATSTQLEVHSAKHNNAATERPGEENK